MSHSIPIISAVAIEAVAKGPAKFTVVAYTGGPLAVGRYPLPVVIDLAGLEFDDRIAVNLDHDPKQRVGHVTDRRNDGREVVLAGVVSATGSAALEFVENGKRDYPWQASVEVRPTERPELIKAGQSVFVNGQTFTGPIFVARKSLLFGLAFLARGADDRTVVSIAASTTGLPMTTNDNTPIEATPTWENTISRDGIYFDDDSIAAAAKIDPARTERHRLEFINRSCDPDRFQPRFSQRIEDMKAKAIDGDMTINELRAGIVDIVRSERADGPSIRASTRDNAAGPIEAALAIQANLPNLEAHYDERTLDAADERLRGFGLQQLLIMAAADNGFQCRPGERITTGNLRNVLQYAFPPGPIHASANSTVNLSGLLSNLANKSLLEGYADEPQEWREIAQIENVNDFKETTSYRLLDNMEYEELTPNGEIAHGELGEDTYTRQANTYAKMLGLTRQQIINDDLSAFQDIRIRLGRGAARKFNKVFWAEFINNSSFFTTARGNYLAGATTTMSSAGLSQAVTLFRKMKSPDGAKVGGRPSIVLVPPELEAAARELYVSTNLNSGGTANASKDGEANIHHELYRPVVVDELSDDDYTGYSALAWYLFREPRMFAPMVVSFLNGRQTPTVETADADFNQLGVQFRGYHDFGCDKAEYVAGVKSKGAA